MYQKPTPYTPNSGQFMMPPQSPVVIQPPAPIIVNGSPTLVEVGGGAYCPDCGQKTNDTQRKTTGCKGWVCILTLCILTGGGLLCFLPCCIDSCKDTEVVCSRCGHVKNTIPASIC